MSASAMPGATARSVAALALPRLANEVITPQTVPKRPTNGATEGVVARKFIRLSRRVSCAVAACWTIRCKTPGDARDFSAPALKTGTRGVNLNASQAVLISERLLPRRKIFQNVSDSLLILRSSRILERIIPQDQIETRRRTAKTIRVIRVVWLRTSIRLS